MIHIYTGSGKGKTTASVGLAVRAAGSGMRVYFFQFLKNGTSCDDFTEVLKQKVSLAKKNMEWRSQYMTWQQMIDDEKDDAREEGFEEGRAEGAQTASRENARNLLALGVAPETIAKGCSLPLQEVLALKEGLSS